MEGTGMEKQKYTAIVLAAGSGKRMNSKVHKQYLIIQDRPVLYYSLKAFEDSAVDEIVPYYTEQDLEDILRSFVIDVRIIGDEYKDKDFTGRQYCEEKGIEIYYNKRDHRFSSTDLRKRIYEAEKAKLDK